jgi:hypothetical protein
MRGINTNVRKSSSKAPVVLATFEWKMNFIDGFPKNPNTSNFT